MGLTLRLYLKGYTVEGIKKAFPKKTGSTKACKTETATGRTEPKGLKEKLMLQTGRIQAVNRSGFISAEVTEQSGAEVLPHP